MLVNGTCGNTHEVKFSPGGRGECTKTSTQDISSELLSLVQVTRILVIDVVTLLDIRHKCFEVDYDWSQVELDSFTRILHV